MAARYVNKEIFIPRSQFPKTEEGTYYWTDLFGCTVTNFDGVVLGVVVDIYDQHGTDVFVIEDAEKNRVQIPNLKPFIESIDITHKKIQAHWEVI
jgi:16S rRNA processing protein RimM